MLPTEIQTKLFSDQVALLYKNIYVSVPASFLCATIIYLGVVAKTSHIGIWYTAALAISIIRLSMILIYNHWPMNDTFHYRLFIAGVIATGFIWGMLDSVLMPPANIHQQMIIIVLIAGITAGGVQSLNPSIEASLIYVCMIIIPLCAWLYSQPGPRYFLLGFSMTVYLAFMVVTCVRNNRILIDGLMLKYENLHLINDLSKSNEALSQSYFQLEQHEHGITIINKLSNLLQSCGSMNEAYAIVADAAAELFMGCSGGIAVMNPKTNKLELLKQWGDTRALKSTIGQEECLSMQHGVVHHVNDPLNESLCSHFSPGVNASICLPIYDQQGMIAELILYSDKKNICTSYQLKLAMGFNEVMQLSLNNISLRETLYEQSTHDALTGLYNRRQMSNILHNEISHAMNEERPLCVAMIDLDHFKRFNDIYGHDAGDHILQEVSKLLKDNLNQNEHPCRFGGEEFLLVLPNVTLDQAYKKLEALRNKVKNSHFEFNNKTLPSLTISAGISEVPTHGKRVREIVKAADEALYYAKKTGRDRVIIYTSDINANI